jgi:hypothetical protein
MFSLRHCVSRVLFAIFQINDFLRTCIYIYITNAAAVCFFFKLVKLISSRNGKKTVFVYTYIYNYAGNSRSLAKPSRIITTCFRKTTEADDLYTCVAVNCRVVRIKLQTSVLSELVSKRKKCYQFYPAGCGLRYCINAGIRFRVLNTYYYNNIMYCP